jgi:hypothetical protein
MSPGDLKVKIAWNGRLKWYCDDHLNIYSRTLYIWPRFYRTSVYTAASRKPKLKSISHDLQKRSSCTGLSNSSALTAYQFVYISVFVNIPNLVDWLFRFVSAVSTVFYSTIIVERLYAFKTTMDKKVRTILGPNNLQSQLIHWSVSNFYGTSF